MISKNGWWLKEDAKHLIRRLSGKDEPRRWFQSEQREALLESRIWLLADYIAQAYVAYALMDEIRSRWDARFVLSVEEEAYRRFASIPFPIQDELTLTPPSFTPALRQALKRLQPSCLLLVAGSGVINPNLVRAVGKSGVPIAWVAAEASASFVEWWKSSAMKEIRKVFIDAVRVICINSEEERERLIDLGFDPSRTHVVGSAKYGAAAPLPGFQERSLALLRQAGIEHREPLIVGGSIYLGEEKPLLDAFLKIRERHPRSALLLAPRQIKHASAMIAEVERRGLKSISRSTLDESSSLTPPGPDVLMIDTQGELKDLYSRASVVFIGRTLTHFSGSNIIEPAAHGKPIVIGPRMDHFRETLEDFLSFNALIQVQDETGLTRAIVNLTENESLRADYGMRARGVVESRSATLKATADILDQTLFRSIDLNRRAAIGSASNMI